MNESPPAENPPEPERKRMGLFERYLTLWVLLCMIAGLFLGRVFPAIINTLRNAEFGSGSQINLPIAILIWLMIYPMMLKVDFSSILHVGKKPAGIFITLFVNWLVKPFSMSAIGWLFFRHVFFPLIGESLANQYIAGCIILAAAPCTAMVFVWSSLTDGDPAYTLVQVSLNDLLMLCLFAPIVALLVKGTSDLVVPFRVLVYSVVSFIMIPLLLAAFSRRILIQQKGADWFKQSYIAFFSAVHDPRFATYSGPHICVSIRKHHEALVPCASDLHSSFDSGIPEFFHHVRSHEALQSSAQRCGSRRSDWRQQLLRACRSNCNHAIWSGIGSCATVVGVLVEVPVMLSVCSFCNRTRHSFEVPTVG